MTDAKLTAEQLFSDRAPCCHPEPGQECWCGEQERPLRAVAAGIYRPMTQAEREWCKNEIVSVEGYDERDAEGSDAEIARTVLRAWMDFVRDKGLI